MNRLHFTLISVLLLLGTLVAQDSNAGENVYTLDKCINIALERNLDLKSKELDIKKFSDKVNQAYANLFPTVNYTGGIAYIIEPEQTTVAIEDPSNPGFAMTMFVDNPDFGFQHAIDVQQIIFSAQAFIGVKLAGQQKSIEEMNRDLLKRQIKTDISKAFYNVIITQQVVEISEMSLEQDLAHSEISDKKFTEGVTSEFEKLRSSVKAKSSQAGLENAKMAHEMSKLYLFMLLDMDYDENAIFSGEFGKPIEIGTENNSISMAHENRLELKIFDETINIYKNLVNLERATYLPNVVAQGTFSHFSGSDTLSKFFEVDDFGKDYQVAIGLQWTLFNGFNRKNKIDEAKRNLKQMELQQRQINRGIDTEIRQKHWQLEQYKLDFVSAESSLDEAQKLIDIANVQFEEGMITFVELNDAQLAYEATQLNYYQSLYNYNTALADYNFAIGK